MLATEFATGGLKTEFSTGFCYTAFFVWNLRATFANANKLFGDVSVAHYWEWSVMPSTSVRAGAYIYIYIYVCMFKYVYIYRYVCGHIYTIHVDAYRDIACMRVNASINMSKSLLALPHYRMALWTPDDHREPRTRNSERSHYSEREKQQ